MQDAMGLAGHEIFVSHSYQFRGEAQLGSVELWRRKAAKE